MFKIFTLAKTTFREMIRERVFMIVILMGLVLIALSFLFGALSLDEEKKMLADFGFLGIEVAGLGIGLFSGAYLISKEIEKQTCLLILSRPVSRMQFILGKTLGLVGLTSVLMFLLGVLVYGLIALQSPVSFVNFASIFVSLWLSSVCITFFVVLASLLVRPALALGSAFVFYLLGQWLGDLKFFAVKSNDEFFIDLVDGIHWVVPNLYKVNWKSWYYLENGITGNSVVFMILHLLAWTVFYALCTQLVFRRKDIV